MFDNPTYRKRDQYSVYYLACQIKMYISQTNAFKNRVFLNTLRLLLLTLFHFDKLDAIAIVPAQMPLYNFKF